MMEQHSRASLIIDGPDCAGKSYLVKELESKFFPQGLIQFHHGPYRSESVISHHYANSLMSYYRLNRTIALDRSWLSEPIYGHVYRNGVDRIGVGQRRMLERLAISTQSVAIIMLPPREVAVKNFITRRDDEYLDTVVQLNDVYDGYVNLVKNGGIGIPYLKYDWTTESAASVLEHAMTIRSPENKGPGSGAWRPGLVTLIVGDRYGPTINERSCKVNLPLAAPQLPFAPFNNTGCSAWFATQLERLHIPERELYWVNAYGGDGKPTDPEFIERLNPKRIIALGGVAGRWLQQSGIHDYKPVNHPAYQKRFHHHEPYTTLEEAFK